MAFLFGAVLIGLLPAAIAREKGYSFLTWWAYGALLFIVALPHAIIMKPNPAGVDARNAEIGMKKCPECAESVRAEANKCRFCGHVFNVTGG